MIRWKKSILKKFPFIFFNFGKFDFFGATVYNPRDALMHNTAAFGAKIISTVDSSERIEDDRLRGVLQNIVWNST